MANRLLILPIAALACVTACAGRPATAPPAGPGPGSPVTSPPVATVQSVPTTYARPEREMVKWIDLQPGDCLADPPPTDPAVVEVRVVDCAAPHRAEAYLRAQVPVNAAVTDTASAQCEAGLPTYTGSAASAARYRIAYLIDSEQDRTYNNPLPSTVICLLEDSAGQWLDGPARG